MTSARERGLRVQEGAGPDVTEELTRNAVQLEPLAKLRSRRRAAAELLPDQREQVVLPAGGDRVLVAQERKQPWRLRAADRHPPLVVGVAPELARPLADVLCRQPQIALVGE